MSGGPTVAILDYGMGNLRSAEKAFEHVGASAPITREHDVVRAADGVVLPGVGAFPKAMAAVRELGLDSLLRERHEAGVPILGICLGMQLLYEGSDEHEGAEGIGLLPGRIEALDAPGLKVPHIGWNPVSWRRESEIADGLPEPCAFYHVHSYAKRETDSDEVVGVASYGQEFASVVEAGDVYGTQFHPEKSGPDGLALLRNFVARCRAGARAAA
ncbi:MAG TPA: imidazole glycerol phosphate synthase subunit HisH [Thermoleophilaceae bacterium]|nr:imidazole glycerol phosphate synthase subunit HisH [Thermoleophilaceae bacterium]